MGALYMDYNADSSIMYYKKSLDIIERMNYYGDKSNVLINLSILNYRKQDYSTALQCAKEAHYYSKMNGIIPYIFGSAKLIAFSFAALNMYDSAYSYHKLYADMRDSSHSAQKSQSIINMQKEFEDKKRTQLSDYESTINLYKLLFLSVIGLIAIFISLFLFKKQKELAKNNVSLQEKNKIIELQKEELSNLNVNKDLLFSIIAHDLRNPVGAMQMIATMLKDNYNDLSQDEKIEFIGYIIVSVQSVNLLLENLLLWSRAQRNIINIHYEDTNPFDLVMIINEIFKPNITNKNLLFENIIPRNLVIKTDENMFMTIMRNIISNAIKFSKSGGTITINYEKLDNKIKFCVTDTGIGMTSEEINNIFKPGKRNPRIGTNDEKGTGLGLLICQDFCKKLNGAIEVNSTLGVGSTFCLMLPAENPIISENQNVTNY
jgi:signal transduction histidine kinase